MIKKKRKEKGHVVLENEPVSGIKVQIIISKGSRIKKGGIGNGNGVGLLL